MNDSVKEIIEESTKKAVEAIEFSIDLLEKLKISVLYGELEVATKAIYCANRLHRYIQERLISETHQLMKEMAEKVYKEDKKNNAVH